MPIISRPSPLIADIPNRSAAVFNHQVKRACGSPTMIENGQTESATPALLLQDDPASRPVLSNKRVTPPDTEMLQFLVSIDTSKDIYAQIVERYVTADCYR